MNLDTAAQEVFQILRSYDYTVMMYDEDGNQVYEPETARRFFAKPENILVSLVEDGDNSSIRLYLGKSTNINDVMGLDQTLRVTATKYNAIFNVRRYGRDIKPEDFSTQTSVTEHKESTMNLLEGMYGTTRSSYLKLENARMIVRHSKKIDEMVMGSRGRHVDAIFVENAQGERFLFPTRQLAPARAMTQHVNQGGGFADQVGQQIIRMAQDFANLGQASGYIAANSEQLSESAITVRETCRQQMREMRKCFERLAREGGYINESLRIEEMCKTLNEHVDANVDITEVRELLTLEGVELNESMLKSVAEAIEANEGRTTEIKDAPCHTCKGKQEVQGHDCPSCGGSGVESKSVVGKKVSAKAWDDFVAGHMEFYQQPTINGSPNFVNKDAKLSFLLAEIVPQVKNDSMLNFLSYVSDQLEENKDPARQKNLRMIAMQAVKIAGLSMDEGFISNHPAIVEFEEWLSSFATKNILAEDFPEDDDDDFDSETSGSGEAADHTTIGKVVNDFSPEDFLDTYGKDFNWGDDQLSGEDLDYDKAYILSSLSHYLSKKIESEYGIEDVDMDAEADGLWNKIEPYLTDAGYNISECDMSEGDLGDIVIPTNQDQSLKREVSVSSATDPFTGEEEPVDSGYVERLRALSGMTRNRY